MSEENINIEPLEPETTLPEVDPYEQEAVAQGWRPKDEWTGAAHEWRPAKEFVERGELFSKIHDLKSENKQIKEALQSLNTHHQKVRETEYKRAIVQLREEKKNALNEGDADKLLQVEEAIDILKEKQQEETQQAKVVKQSGPTPEFINWTQQNAWYVADNEMRQFADDVGVGFFNRNPGKSESEVYEYVLKRTKQAFPEKFKGTAPSAPQVEGGSGGRAPAKRDSFTLSEEEERVMKTFVRTGVMTADEYKAELKRVKGIA